jgi:hypothetical protein
MVRITTPVQNSDSESLQAAIQLAAETSVLLPEFIPD